MTPCKFDHNGECLICDCWILQCPFPELIRRDWTNYTEEEFKEMFGDFIVGDHLGIMNFKN